MEKELKCLRCGCEMQFMSKENIRLGPQSILENGLGALVSDTLETDVYVCPQCRKLEFYAASYVEPVPENDPEAVTCPGCQRRHKYGLMNCPHCGRQYVSCPWCGAVHDAYVSFCPNCRHEHRGKKKKKEGKTESSLSKYL